jgi:periplasmic protein CpxP/Spy
MRNIIGMLVIALLVSTTINAQNEKENNRKGADFTPEQKATLQTKTMALHFDLDKNQQEAIYALKKRQADERQKNVLNLKQNKQKDVQLSNDERFEFQNNRLERQLENKAEIKKILTKEQFSKWENDSKIKGGKKHIAKGNRNNQEKRNDRDPRDPQRNRN